MVSIQTTSAPPAFSPSICSTNTSSASASVSGPSGTSRSPVGPTEPATITRRPAASATVRACLGREPIQFAGAALGPVQRQAPAIAAETVGEDDVGAGIDEGLVQPAHPLGELLVPQLRRLAGGQAHVEQVGAGRAIGQQPVASVKKFVEHQQVRRLCALNCGA